MEARTLIHTFVSLENKEKVCDPSCLVQLHERRPSSSSVRLFPNHLWLFHDFYLNVWRAFCCQRFLPAFCSNNELCTLGKKKQKTKTQIPVFHILGGGGGGGVCRVSSLTIAVASLLDVKTDSRCWETKQNIFYMFLMFGQQQQQQQHSPRAEIWSSPPLWPKPTSSMFVLTADRRLKHNAARVFRIRRRNRRNIFFFSVKANFLTDIGAFLEDSRIWSWQILQKLT